jgi:hypothetical protein
VTNSSGTQIIGQFAFSGCPNLKAFFFRGDAPSVPQTAFFGTTDATIFYLPWKSGWAGTFGGPGHRTV